MKEVEDLEDEVKQQRSVIASLESEMDLSAIRLIRKEERKAEKLPSTPLLLIVQAGSVDPRWSDSVSSEDALALSFFSDSPPCWQHRPLPPEERLAGPCEGGASFPGAIDFFGGGSMFVV